MKIFHLAIIAFLVIATTHAASGQTSTAQTVHVFTDKDHYDAGDTIVVLGTAAPEQYVQILVIDPNLLIQYKNDTYADSAGSFTYKLTLPQFVKSGEWKIRATSGQDHVILSVPVGNKVRTDPTELPPYTYEPGTPLKQLESGVLAKDILCRPGLGLIIQTQRGVPSCVRPLTAQILVARGLANDVTYNPTLAGSATDLSALGMEFSTDRDIVISGKAIGINISLNNTSSIPLKIMPENSWTYQNLSLGEQCGFRSPMGMAIFYGYYTEQNMTLGKVLPVFPQYMVSCPVMTAAFQTQSFVFEPKSSHAFESTCNNGNEVCGGPDNLAQHLEINGTWNNGRFQSFEPGIYTIIGGDEWGHLEIEHFVVSNSTIFAGNLGLMSCPQISGGIQFGAAIKNATGFANYYNSTQYGNTFFMHPGMRGTVTVQYSSPANAAWFQNHGNAPYNMTDGAALFYMANVTEGKSIISYVASLYNDETGHHSQICHYGIQFGGGFAEPCDTDNTGDIPLAELPYASKLLHVGIDASFEPNSVMLYPDSNPVFTAKISANSNVTPGVYWLSLGRSLCGPGVLAKLVVLP